MRLCRFDDERVGVVDGAVIRDVTAVRDLLPSLRWPVPPGDQLIAHLPQIKDRIQAAAEQAATVSLEHATLLSPVANPCRIIAAPLNYKLHVDESSDPAIHYGVHMPSHEGFATPIDKFGPF
jgi:hypothetical protein